MHRTFTFKIPVAVIGALWRRATAVAIAAVALFSTAIADPVLRVADLHDGRPAVVKGRIGERVATREVPGTFVFTIRDDFGSMILGYTKKDIGDIRFGATYLLHGTPKQDPATKELHLEVSSWELFYTPSYTLFWVGGAVILLIVLVGFVILSRRVKPVPPPPKAWDFAEIMSGPDQGKLIPLKELQIPVGRRQDPEHCLSIVQDTFVSRDHGMLIRRGDQTFYTDSGSRCGSWVDERKVEAGEEAPVMQGSILRLGPHTTIRIGTASTAGVNDDTRMPTEQPYSDSAAWHETPGG